MLKWRVFSLLLFFLSSCSHFSDYEVKYINHYLGIPRNVEYMWAVAGSCKPIDGSVNGYLIDGRISNNNSYDIEDFAISIQTSNISVDSELISFAGFPKSFKFGETATTMFDYLDEPNIVYSNLFDSVFRKVLFNPKFPDDAAITINTQPVFYEYRNDYIKEISIKSNVPLFNKNAGEDISDKFNIVLFYMNTIGCPAYIISQKNDKSVYAYAKGNIRHKSDDMDKEYLSDRYILSGKTYEPYISTDINLKDWSKGKFFVDPAMIIKFSDVPDEVLKSSYKVVLTVELNTSNKTLISQTPELTLYN